MLLFSTEMGPVLKSEFPYAHVVMEDVADRACSYCMKMTAAKSLKHCARCKFVSYCDSNCQKRDWPDHKAECCFIAKAHPILCSSIVRLLTRIIAKGKRSVKPAFNGRTMDSLESHAKDIKRNVSRYGEFNIIAASLLALVGSENLPSPAEVLELYGKVVINSFGIFGTQVDVVGTGLYIGLSELNHSCDPDAYHVFDGATIVIRALKAGVTKYDGKLCIPYCPLVQHGSVRRALLNERWFFNCDCVACTNKERDSVGYSLRCQYCDGGYCPVLLEDSSVTGKPECAQCGLPTSQDVDDAVALMKKLDAEAGKLHKLTGLRPVGSISLLPSTVFRPGPGSKSDIEAAVERAKKLYAKGELVLSHFNISLCNFAEVLSRLIAHTVKMFSCVNESMAYNAKLHKKIIICYRKFLPEEFPCVCNFCLTTGCSLALAVNIEMAKKWLEKTIRLSTKTYGREDYHTIQAQQFLSILSLPIPEVELKRLLSKCA